MMTIPTPNPDSFRGPRRDHLSRLTSLTLRNHGASAVHVPVTTGVCLPPGTVFDARRLSVAAESGEPRPTQADVTARWSDGSVKWVLLSFVVPQLPAGSSDWAVGLALPRPAAQELVQPISVTENGLQLTTAAGQVSIRFPLEMDGLQLQPDFTSTGVSAGPVRGVFEAHGVFRKAGLRLLVRTTWWAETGRIRLDVALHNPRAARHRGGLWDLGDPASCEFDSFDVVIDGPASEFGGTLEGEPLQWANAGRLTVFQASSGGENWDSSNHWNRRGETPCPFCGYRASSPGGSTEGDRAEPVAVWRNAAGALGLAVPEFWQQFPGSMLVEPGRMQVGVFPGEWPDSFELQGGERKTRTLWLSSAAETSDVLPVLPQLTVSLCPEWVDTCGAMPWFSASPGAADDRVEEFLRRGLAEGNSWAERREVIDEFGWRNFGDVHADHEQTYFDGEGAVVSHYNNQFDLIYGGVQHYLRSGTADWFDFLDQLARHVADIDIYHTNEDRAAYNGGLFWHTDHYVDARTATHRTYSRRNAANKPSYGGGLSCEHNYSTGLLHHYYLSGSAESRAAVIELAEWVLAMDDGRRTVFSLLDDGPTGLASSTVHPDYQGPGRGPGNSLNTLLDAWLLTHDSRYLAKADELVRRVVHPAQDLDELNLTDSEGHWSYTVFLTALARYGEMLIEADQLDEIYAFVRSTMQHYGRWMAEHEKPALSEPERLEYVTEAWAAQDFRKANVLRLCAAFEDDAAWVQRMRARADEIADRAWADLDAFERPCNARTLSIVMTEGLRDAWHRTHPPQSPAPQPRWVGEFGGWTMFVPQRDRVLRGLRRPSALAGMLLRALNPVRWRRCIVAAWRQFS